MEHEEQLNICEECGCTDEQLYYVDDEGRYLCIDCLHDLGYEICDDCGAIVPADEIVVTNEGSWDEAYVCTDCLYDHYTQCSDCGNWVSDRHLSLYDRNTYICDNCSDHWVCCDDCGAVIRVADAVYHDGDGCWYCYNCIDEHHQHRLQSYSYKPAPVFHHRSSEDEHELYMGVELEVDKGDDADVLVEELDEIGMPIYMKHDGSLDDGVEIVTHPCTLGYHMYDMRWAEIARRCRNNGYKSHDAETCGLHIHVGREQLGDCAYRGEVETSAKIVLIVDAIWDSIVRFSRRTESQLDDWAKKPSVDKDDPDRIAAAIHAVKDTRYHAVNLMNTGSVEFRVFRGTLRRDTIIASLQLVSNICKYAMTHTAEECDSVTLSDILAVEHYDELTEYCTQRNLL